jgi:hypothetical protein
VNDDRPHFLVPQESRWRSCARALAALWEAPPAGVLLTPSVPELFAREIASSARRDHRGNLYSTVIHFSVGVFFLQAPMLPFARAPETPQPEVVYELKSVNLSRYLPSLRARGPGGRPGRGTKPDKLPARGSTAFHPKVTVVSNPPRPDNTRQTIIQSSSPPELKIKVDLPLPNVVLGEPMLARRQPVEFRLDQRVRPAAARRSKAVSPAPDMAARPSDLAIAPSPVINPLPRLEVAPPPPMGLGEGSVRVNTAGIAEASGPNWAEADPGGLLVLGIDPAAATGNLALPAGNRYGEFSISPFGGQPGSPGGVPGGDPQGGSGGPGTGGDGSSGIGPGGGGGGGGGGALGNTAGISIAGGSGTGSFIGGFGEGSGEAGAFDASLPSSLVYPVRPPPRPRLGGLTVTTGPIGGGGLRVYGVLRGGKVYTKYFSMPGRSWVLQYVHNTGSAERRSGETRTAVAHLEQGLMPPDAEKQFDFRRPPVPKDKQDEFIVLRGTIREDGSVGDLRVFQGIEPLADQAALAAFSRWKFRPALRGGQPVTVEILVGVPAHIETSDTRVVRSPTGD